MITRRPCAGTSLQSEEDLPENEPTPLPRLEQAKKKMRTTVALDFTILHNPETVQKQLRTSKLHNQLARSIKISHNRLEGANQMLPWSYLHE